MFLLKLLVAVSQSLCIPEIDFIQVRNQEFMRKGGKRAREVTGSAKVIVLLLQSEVEHDSQVG